MKTVLGFSCSAICWNQFEGPLTISWPPNVAFFWPKQKSFHFQPPFALPLQPQQPLHICTISHSEEVVVENRISPHSLVFFSRVVFYTSAFIIAWPFSEKSQKSFHDPSQAVQKVGGEDERIFRPSVKWDTQCQTKKENPVI